MYCEASAGASGPGRLARTSRTADRTRSGLGTTARRIMACIASSRAPSSTALNGREVPQLDDLKAVAPLVLGHRIVLNFQAEAAGMRSPELVDQLVAAVL